MEKESQTSSHALELNAVPASRENALLGLRGLLAIQTILYIIFVVFFPAAVVDSANGTGPKWQLVLRASFSIFLWNPSLIRASLIILSARTICLPFLRNPTSLTLARSLFRRPIRLLIPIIIALAVAAIYNKSSSVDKFKALTGNVSLPTPYVLPSALTYFNSVYTLFWTVRDYADQAANNVFYNDSLWATSVIYTQSYTVYLAAVIIPFTRVNWRLVVWTLFILTAWWVQSWAWFSISGLFLADASIHMRLQERMAEGILLHLGKGPRRLAVRVPGWFFGVFLVLAGGTLQYFWREWRPQYGTVSAVAQPQARDDDFLIVIGILILLESLQWLQKVMANKVFVAIGERSLSLYLVGSIVINILGVELFLHSVQDSGFSSAAGIAVSLVVCLITIPLLTEVLFRAVEVPTGWISSRLFDWIRE